MTDNIDRRLLEHRNKKSFYTKQFSDLKLVYQEEFMVKLQAEIREKQLKGWSVAKKKALIDNNKDILIQLSKGSDSVEDL